MDDVLVDEMVVYEVDVKVVQMGIDSAQLMADPSADDLAAKTVAVKAARMDASKVLM